MKNKIIFKTLMLKGEAGSTIVSMEKTGHVGTADIYTITFNDGSTTEISLENMSAITSVEKTSSTDTEDIYTITCADGSTQTFSVLNHNADIAAMSDDIDTIDARVDNFINSVVPNTVETLWTGSIGVVGDSATLSKAVSNFDYIDLYLLGSADSKYIRVPATQTWVQIQQQNLSDDASSNFLRLWEMGVSISGSTVSITKSIAWAWDDPNNSNPTVTANAQNGVPITRIDGVKSGSDSPAELVDIRVGGNGITYNSAGAAVRGQYTELNDLLYEAALVTGYKKSNSFSINSGSTHSSAKDILKVLVPSGKAFDIITNLSPTDATRTAEYKAYYSDGTTATVMSGKAEQHYRITAAATIVGIGVYINAVSSDTTATLSFEFDGDDMQEKMNDANVGADNFKWHTSLVLGGLSSGAVVSAYKYRVSTPNTISFDRDITITPKSGFKFGIHTFVNGSFSTDSGWKTAPYTVPANTAFKIVIARTTENTSEIANIETFADSVLFDTQIGHRLTSLENEINGVPDYY